MESTPPNVLSCVGGVEIIQRALLKTKATYCTCGSVVVVACFCFARERLA